MTTIARPRIRVTTYHPEATDWVRRVGLVGGGVSPGTAGAVSRFCFAADRGGWRDRFLRLNLFCGGQNASPTGLNACLVPLYLGRSFGGARFGNATDTNVGPFVSGDYSETGASGGLQGSTARGLRLKTGLAFSTMPAADVHLAAYEIAQSNDINDASIGARHVAANEYCELGLANPATNYGFTGFRNTYAAALLSGYTSPGALMIGSVSGTSISLYRRGSLAASATAATQLTSALTSHVAVFATENEAAANVDLSNARLGGYSAGLSMNASQALSYHNAMQAFQSSLGRAV